MAQNGCEPPARVAGFSDPERAALIREAFRLEWFTVAWMMVEAIVALASGIAAQSITLLAFGIDSLIELASAGVLGRTHHAGGRERENEAWMPRFERIGDEHRCHSKEAKGRKSIHGLVLTACSLRVSRENRTAPIPRPYRCFAAAYKT